MTGTTLRWRLTMTEPTFEVISLASSADGWRAIISSDSGASVVPLACWEAFGKKTRGQPDEILISGVWPGSSPGGPVRFLVRAAAAASLEGFFPPGHPDPPST
jgi:hypothetical protein